MKTKTLKYKIIFAMAGLLLSVNNSFAQIEDLDPFEAYNRPVFEFNNVLDKVILLPAALVYREFVPDAFKIPFENLLGQVRYPISAINYGLQGKWELSAHSAKKIFVNMTTTLGTGDIKLDEPIDKNYRHTNFNTTLNLIDVPSGPYLVLPLAGGNSARGSAAGLVDNWFFTRNKNVPLAQGVVTRSQNIEILETLEETSIDYYSAMRNIIMQIDNNSGKSKPSTSNIDSIDFSDEDLN